jgi:hypothetical protein
VLEPFVVTKEVLEPFFTGVRPSRHIVHATSNQVWVDKVADYLTNLTRTKHVITAKAKILQFVGRCRYEILSVSWLRSYASD